jgi:hypothetical protein
MQPKNYDTVTEAMADLKELGYTIDFSIKTDEECLNCHLSSNILSPDEFEIDDFYRFEGDSDPGDAMIVYAISSKNRNLKGIVVNAYGLYANNASSAIVKKLDTHPEIENKNTNENINHLENPNSREEDSSPRGACPNCWGRQQYDGKIRDMQKDKQIDVNNHKDSYMVIQEFVKTNIDGKKLKEGEVEICPQCGNKHNED